MITEKPNWIIDSQEHIRGVLKDSDMDSENLS